VELERCLLLQLHDTPLENVEELLGVHPRVHAPRESPGQVYPGLVELLGHTQGFSLDFMESANGRIERDQ
jgi:hypothetical protein